MTFATAKLIAWRLRLEGTPGNITWIPGSRVDRSPIPFHFHILIPRAGIVEQHRGNAGQGTWKGALSIHFVCCHYCATKLLSARNSLLERGYITRVLRSQGQIDKIYSFIAAPVQRPKQNLPRCDELTIEDFDGISFGGGSLFTDGSSYGRTMAKKIIKAIIVPFKLDVNTAGYRLRVRVRGVESAVDHGNTDL